MKLLNSEWLPRNSCQNYKFNSNVYGNKETELTVNLALILI